MRRSIPVTMKNTGIAALLFSPGVGAHAGHDHGGSLVNGLLHSLQGWETAIAYALLAIVCYYGIRKFYGY